MRLPSRTAGLVCAGLLVALLPSWSQARYLRWLGPGGWEAGGEYDRAFNAGAVVTVSGEVVQVDTFTPWKAMANGVRVLLKVAEELVPVHMGPQWFLDHQELRVARGDRIDVRGARVTFQGEPVIMASVVTRGNQTMRLRDESGRPVWSAAKKR